MENENLTYQQSSDETPILPVELKIRLFGRIEDEIEHAEDMTEHELLFAAGKQAAMIAYENLLIKSLAHAEKTEKGLSKQDKDAIKTQISQRKNNIQSRTTIMTMFSNIYLDKFLLKEMDEEIERSSNKDVSVN